MPKILAVDDSATMRRIYEMTFAGQDGFEVVTVDTGDAAVRHALERGADLVLADASMSGTSGYEVAKALRDAGGANIPVVLLASAQSPFDAERARASGIDDHILKPFDTQSLIDKARDVMGRRGARPVAAAPISVAAPAVAASTMVARPPSAAPAPAVGGSIAAPRPAATRSTASFGAPAGARPPVALPPSAIIGARPPMAAPIAPIALTARKPAEPAPQVSAAAAAASNEMAGKLSGMGLSPEQVQGVLSLSREVIERVVWEVVPDMAERIIRDEIRRLTS